MGVDKPHIIEFQRIPDSRGNLAVIAKGNGCPFEIRRVFYIYGIPTDAVRGGHAHINSNHILIAVAGSFDVEVTDGESVQTFTLQNPDKGLFVPAGHWQTMSGFAVGSVCLSLSDSDYDEADYQRDYNEFLTMKAIKEQ